jgi:hypothetical protein
VCVASGFQPAVTLAGNSSTLGAVSTRAHTATVMPLGRTAWGQEISDRLDGFLGAVSWTETVEPLPAHRRLCLPPRFASGYLEGAVAVAAESPTPDHDRRRKNHRSRGAETTPSQRRHHTPLSLLQAELGRNPGEPTLAGPRPERLNDLDRGLAAVEDWIVDGLPYWNNRLLGGTASVHAFADELRDRLNPILRIGLLGLARADRDRAREALAMLAFCACSIERATQTAGHDPGDGVKLVLGLADAMTALAVSAEMAPNLSQAGYWTANTGIRWLSFTGDPQERFFCDMVNAICDEHGVAIEQLEMLKHVRLTSVQASHLLRKAAETQKKVRRYYARFRNTVDRHNLEMTIDFFKNIMRTFLVAFPVNGVTWKSANAANVVEQTLLDFTIGIVDDDYIKHVQERMRYMAAEERQAILDAMRSPSVLDRILEELSLTPADVLAVPVDALAARLRATPQMCRTLHAFREFKEAAAAASGAHFGLIIEYLVKSEDGTGGRRAVDPGRGTGGRAHGETKRVQEMRAKHPVAHNICIATRLAWPTTGGAQAVEA